MANYRGSMDTYSRHCQVKSSELHIIPAASLVFRHSLLFMLLLMSLLMLTITTESKACPQPSHRLRASKSMYGSMKG